MTALVGGPHVFGTFTATFADKGFRKNHPLLIASSLLIPAGVVWLTVGEGAWLDAAVGAVTRLLG